MSDLTRLKSLLDDFGIGYEPYENGLSVSHVLGLGSNDPEQYQDNPKVQGYGFYATFTFAPDGTFEEMGIWE